MNLFILTDLEGIAGIDSIHQMDRTREEYTQSRAALTRSINLAVATAIDCGADCVYFLDGHGGGGNVLDDKIDPRAKKCTIAEWQELLASGAIDCQIELGAHTRAGTEGGFLDHTLSSVSIFHIKVNGREMSEVSLHAALCGAYGVPIVAVLGDEAACEQAREYLPGVITGALKKASCRNRAQTYVDADEILKRTVTDALLHYKDAPIFTIKGPCEVEYCYYRSDMCEDAMRKNGDTVTRFGARCLRKTVAEIKRYEDFKI